MAGPALKPAEVKRRRAIIRTGLEKFLAHPKGYATSDLFQDKQHHKVPFYCQRVLKTLRDRHILSYLNKRYWVGPNIQELRDILGEDDRVDSLFLDTAPVLPESEPEEIEPAEGWNAPEAPSSTQDLRVIDNNEANPPVPVAAKAEPSAEEGADMEAFVYMYRLVEQIYAALDEGRAVPEIRMLFGEVEKGIRRVEAKIEPLSARIDRLASEQEAFAKLYLETAGTLQEIHVLFQMFAQQEDFFTQIKECHEVLMFMKTRMLGMPRETPKAVANGARG